MHVVVNNENVIQVAKIESVKVKNITYTVYTSICGIAATHTSLVTNLVTPLSKLR
jgi:acid phosphatase family membrane protein YuiD